MTRDETTRRDEGLEERSDVRVSPSGQEQGVGLEQERQSETRMQREVDKRCTQEVSTLCRGLCFSTRVDEGSWILARGLRVEDSPQDLFVYVGRRVWYQPSKM